MNKLFLLLAISIFLLPSIFAFNTGVTGLDINHDRSELLVGDQYTLIVHLTNDSGQSVNTTLHIIDNDEEKFQLAYRLSERANIDLNIQYGTIIPGDHELTARIDTNDDYAADNSFGRILTFKRGIDVEVAGAFFPTIQTERADVNSHVIIQNNGDLPSWFFTAQAFLDAAMVKEFRVQPMNPGEIFTTDINFSSGLLGGHTFRIELDVNHELKEYYRQNNSFSVPFNTREFSESVLTRDDIERILEEFMKGRQEDLTGQLNMCLSDSNLFRSQASDCQAQKDVLSSSLAEKSNQITTLEAAKTQLEVSLSSQHDFDENQLSSLQNSYEQQFRDLNLSSSLLLSAKEKEIEQSNMMLTVFGIIIALFCGFVIYLVYYKGV